MQVYIITRQTYINGQPIREDNPVVVTYLSHEHALQWLVNLANREHQYHNICHIPTTPDILESLSIKFAGTDTIYTIIREEVL